MARSFMDHVLYWTPRVVGLATVAFLMMFAGDVFTESGDWWQTAIALLVHLIPAALVLGATLVAWRRPVIGGMMFLAFAVGYAWMVMAGGHPLEWIVVISGPLVVVGFLFLVSETGDSSDRRRRRARNLLGRSS
jgi:hypothetical protein